MAGEILYFMHRHVRLLAAGALVLTAALVIGGVAGMVFSGQTGAQTAANPLEAGAPPAA